MPKGDCFRAALDLAKELTEIGGEPFVCHGLVVAGSGPLAGQRHWHAWVEIKSLDGGWVAMDHSNDKAINLLRREYYELAKIDRPNRQVWRFGVVATARAMHRFEHTGPWVNEYQRIETEVNQ